MRPGALRDREREQARVSGQRRRGDQVGKYCEHGDGLCLASSERGEIEVGGLQVVPFAGRLRRLRRLRRWRRERRHVVGGDVAQHRGVPHDEMEEALVVARERGDVLEPRAAHERAERRNCVVGGDPHDGLDEREPLLLGTAPSIDRRRSVARIERDRGAEPRARRGGSYGDRGARHAAQCPRDADAGAPLVDPEHVPFVSFLFFCSFLFRFFDFFRFSIF